MSSEIQVQSSLVINKISSTGIPQVQYISRPSTFTADMTGNKGPTPGAILVPILGVNIDLSGLSTPGFCVIKNLGRASDGSTDPIYYISVGMFDAETARYYPMLELLPGEAYPVRLARDIEEEYGITGTGTWAPGTNRLRLRANNSPVNASVEAFEK